VTPSPAAIAARYLLFVPPPKVPAVSGAASARLLRLQAEFAQRYSVPLRVCAPGRFGLAVQPDVGARDARSPVRPDFANVRCERQRDSPQHWVTAGIPVATQVDGRRVRSIPARWGRFEFHLTEICYRTLAKSPLELTIRVPALVESLLIIRFQKRHSGA
jgi:hypothetical protein